MKLNVKDMVLVALFCALIAVGAFIKIPFLIVPITLQTLFVMAAALILKKRLAVMSVLLYIVLGLIGLPIFAKGGGIGYLAQPTFGYLLGFIASAYFIESYRNRWNVYLVCFIGILITYLFGVLYFVFIQHYLYDLRYEVKFLVTNLFLIFLPGDIASALVAIEASKRLTKKRM